MSHISDWLDVHSISVAKCLNVSNVTRQGKDKFLYRLSRHLRELSCTTCLPCKRLSETRLMRIILFPSCKADLADHSLLLIVAPPWILDIVIMAQKRTKCVFLAIQHFFPWWIQHLSRFKSELTYLCRLCDFFRTSSFCLSSEFMLDDSKYRRMT